MGLAEIESKLVLQDLLGKTVLRKWPYQLVHYDSPDRRGIDVALLYNKEHFKLVHSQALPFVCEAWPTYKSRDILHVQLRAKDGSLINFLICHWPSRYGGKLQTAPKRYCAAQVLNNYRADLKGAVIIMGDFNDAPQDESMRYLADGLPGLDLINLMQAAPSYLGSHRYKGEWSYLDQILVDKVHYKRVKLHGVFAPSFLLEEETKYPGFKPRRAFRAKFYRGGFSDHLPIYLDWELWANLLVLESDILMNNKLLEFIAMPLDSCKLATRKI